jgi:alpha-D-xyloside xylohydrolase
VKESENAITITGAQLSPYIKLRPWSFKFVDSKGREVLGDNPLDVDGLGKPFVLPLGYVFEGETIEKVPVTTSFHLRQDEHLFGLGEKFTPLDKRMQKIISWTVDALGSTSERSHKNIPFLISARGYGLFIDGGGRITWDLGTSSCQSYTVINENTSFDAYIIYGPTPAKILKHYSDRREEHIATKNPSNSY